jgi:mutator protein MutT
MKRLIEPDITCGSKRSVAGIAVENGRIFIAKRVSGGDIGGAWEFPGGKVEAEETDEQALIREYREELGVKIRVGDYLGQAEFEHKEIKRTVFAYFVYFLDKNFALSEHTEWRWASLEEIAVFNEDHQFADSDAKLLVFLNMHPDC